MESPFIFRRVVVFTVIFFGFIIQVNAVPIYLAEGSYSSNMNIFPNLAGEADQANYSFVTLSAGDSWDEELEYVHPQFFGLNTYLYSGASLGADYIETYINGYQQVGGTTWNVSTSLAAESSEFTQMTSLDIAFDIDTWDDYLEGEVELYVADNTLGNIVYSELFPVFCGPRSVSYSIPLNSDHYYFYGLTVNLQAGDSDFFEKKLSASMTIDATPIPEPGTFLLLGFGILCLAVLTYRRKAL